MKKVVLIAALAIVSVAGFFGWKFYKKITEAM